MGYKKILEEVEYTRFDILTLGEKVPSNIKVLALVGLSEELLSFRSTEKRKDRIKRKELWEDLNIEVWREWELEMDLKYKSIDDLLDVITDSIKIS